MDKDTRILLAAINTIDDFFEYKYKSHTVEEIGVYVKQVLTSMNRDFRREL